MVFYFTGTGNSLYAAKFLDEEAISIPQILKREELVFTANKIGIVCPVYGHEMPAMVKVFLRKATFQTDYLYLVLTYGARKRMVRILIAVPTVQKTNWITVFALSLKN